MIFQLAGWLSWLAPIFGAILIPIVARVNSKILGWYAVLVSSITAGITLSMIPAVVQLNGQPIVESVWWIEAIKLKAGVLIDPLSVFMANIASCVGTLIMLYAVGYMSREEGLPRFYFFNLLFIGGMIGLVLADNFLQMYIFWEIVGLCSYALIGFWYNKPSAARAGMKAFVVTRVGDVFLLAGILLLYLYTGTFDFLQARDVLQLGQLSLPTLAISLFVFLGAVGKSGQVPLHVWLPDAMEGPTPVSALIHAATMVKAGIYLVGRTYILFASVQGWLTAVAYTGAITALLAASMALVNTDLKRTLAYSTISQLGLIMATLGLGTQSGWFAGQFHVLSHALFKSLLFLCAGSVMHALGTTDMRLMGGLRKDMPITFLASLVGALSLAGFPPFNGFWSKELILGSVLEAGNYPVFILVVGASILTVAYSLRWITVIFLRERSNYVKNTHIHERQWAMLIPLLALGFLSIISGFSERIFSQFMGVHSSQEGSLQVMVLAVSLTILLTGSLATYLGYFKNGISSRRWIVTRPIERIISEGYYFDKVYSRVFVEGLFKSCFKIFKRIEVGRIDRFNYVLADSALSAYKGIRRIQTGILSYNMLLTLLGFLILLAFILWRV